MISSLRKGINILFLFSGDRPTLTVRQIAHLQRLTSPTAYRFVGALQNMGLLQKDSLPGHYRLGLRLLELEDTIHRNLDIEVVARPFLKQLAQASGETAQLTLLSDQQGICISIEESRSTLRVAPEKGRILPLHAGASMQAIMAFLPSEDQNVILNSPLKRFTPATITDPDKLMRRLAAIRRGGFALSKGEVYSGAIGIAAPIFSSKGGVIASIAVSGPTVRMMARRMLTEQVLAAGTEISRILGNDDASKVGQQGRKRGGLG
jgi:DNA-binding IclR family transcriptional regulator